MTSFGCFRTNFPTTAATFAASPYPGDQRGEVEPRPDQVAPRDRRGDVPEVADDDDPARDPAAQVVDVVVVVGAPLPEDGAEQELAAHLQ